MTPTTDPLRRADLSPELAHLPATIPAALHLRLRSGADPFVIGVGFRLTFAEADAQSAEMAGRLLAGGIGKGTRVGLLFANGAEWAVTWLALARIGALTVPLSTFSPGAELSRMVRQTDIHALLMSERFGGELMTTRLESGLTGLLRSRDDLQLEDAPFLRWIHVETQRPPGWSRALPTPLTASLMRARRNLRSLPPTPWRSSIPRVRQLRPSPCCTRMGHSSVMPRCWRRGAG